MEIKKKGDDTFNVYSITLSWGQLIALHAALQKDHSGPVLDEVYAELDWYLNQLPKPGESKDKGKGSEGAPEGGEPVGPMSPEEPGFLDSELPPVGEEPEVGGEEELPPEEEPLAPEEEGEPEPE